jgi:hypothetical protein
MNPKLPLTTRSAWKVLQDHCTATRDVHLGEPFATEAARGPTDDAGRLRYLLRLL